MKRTILAVVAVMVLACAGEGNDWPDVEALYSVNGQALECAGTVSQSGEPAGGPFTEYTCAWERVQFEGRPRCYVVVSFERDGADAPWSAYAYGSSATCD